MEGIVDDLAERGGWGHEVHETPNGCEAIAAHVTSLGCPVADEGDEDAVGECTPEHLRDEVDERDEGGLQDDGCVRVVEELNGVVTLVVA